MADTDLPEFLDTFTGQPAAYRFFLQRNKGLGIKTVSALAMRFAADLQGLDFWGCTGITDGAAVALANAAEQGNLQQLEYLYLSDCTGVSDVFFSVIAKAAKQGNLQQLFTLYLTATGITGESLSILAQAAKQGNLQNLCTLHLGGCAGLTDEFIGMLAQAAERGNLRQLRELYLTGSGFTVDRTTLRTNKWSVILDAYHSNTLQSGLAVMLLGQPASGKTWLYKGMFRGEPHEFDDIRVPTEGFELGDALREVDIGGRSVKLRAFCFGGDLIQHGVHELIMHDRALYLLVLNAGRNSYENQVAFWLKLIHHYSVSPGLDRTAPLLMVVNQCDGHCHRVLEPVTPQSLHVACQGYGLSENNILEDFSCLKSERYKDQQDRLYQAIEGVLADSHLLRGKVNPTLPIAEKLLDKLLAGKPMIPKAKYEEACRADENENVARDNYVNLQQLHWLGVAFHFGEVPNENDLRRTHNLDPTNVPPGLKRLLTAERDSVLERWIIHPGWLRWPLYYAVIKAERSGSRGILRRDEIYEAIQKAIVKECLPEIAGSDKAIMYDLVTAVLKLTGVCHRMDNGEFLFPNGLDSLPMPDWEADDYDEIVVRWDFLHDMAMHRYIVAAHNSGVVWRTESRPRHGRDGVVIEEGPVRAALRADPSQGTLTIRLRGGTHDERKGLWLVIRHAFFKVYVGKDGTVTEYWRKSSPTGFERRANPDTTLEVDEDLGAGQPSDSESVEHTGGENLPPRAQHLTKHDNTEQQAAQWRTHWDAVCSQGRLNQWEKVNKKNRYLSALKLLPNEQSKAIPRSDLYGKILSGEAPRKTLDESAVQKLLKLLDDNELVKRLGQGEACLVYRTAYGNAIVSHLNADGSHL